MPNAFYSNPMKWKCRDLSFDLSKKAIVMGILNVTPDSFSDGGRFHQIDRALEQAAKMLEEGAGIIDIGGESTRPGAAAVSVEEEQQRVIPVIEELLRQRPGICLSIDTSKPDVAKSAIEAGATIINDVTGFRQKEMTLLAAGTGAGIVAMHMRGTPETMQHNPSYRDVTSDVRDFFQRRHDEFLALGIDPETITYDPGIGFGKTLTHNLQLLRDLDKLSVSHRPLLLGASRKCFIGKVLKSDKLEDRSAATVAITTSAREKGVMLHRVHEVKPNLQSLRMIEALLGNCSLPLCFSEDFKFTDSAQQ